LGDILKRSPKPGANEDEAENQVAAGQIDVIRGKVNAGHCGQWLRAAQKAPQAWRSTALAAQQTGQPAGGHFRLF
jgi:hypothetical protein